MQLQLRPLMVLTADLEAPQIFGATPDGNRKTVLIQGGRVEGDRVRGQLIPGGGDWARVRSDGVLILDVRLTIETDDGALIHCEYEGMRHGSPEVMARLAAGEYLGPENYYFRIAPRFQTASREYAWLNRLLAVGTGERLVAGPRYHIYEVL